MQAVARVEGDAGGFHKVVTVLVEMSQRHLRSETLRHADHLLHGGRVKINGVAGRVPMRRKLDVEERTRTLLQTSRDLATATSLASVQTALASRMAACSMEAFYVCCYEGDGGPSPWSRLIAAYDSERNLHLPKEGLRFPTERLLPEAIVPPERLAAYIVCPIDCGEGRSGYVVFEGWTGQGLLQDGLAGQIGSTLRKIRLLERLVTEARAREVAEAKRLRSEMRIATEIQAGILPHAVRVEGLEIAAAMRPATEVAGDYYDVVPTEHGCWIGIGDVTGHGLTAGLVMLMVHSVVRGVSLRNSDAAPSEIFSVLNAVLYDNVHNRMGQEQHATLTLIRYDRSGRLMC
jgi:sigma-B regulation protein RsbU (phosphoserine phosphatase)